MGCEAVPVRGHGVVGRNGCMHRCACAPGCNACCIMYTQAKMLWHVCIVLCCGGLPVAAAGAATNTLGWVAQAPFQGPRAEEVPPKAFRCKRG